MGEAHVRRQARRGGAAEEMVSVDEVDRPGGAVGRRHDHMHRNGVLPHAAQLCVIAQCRKRTTLGASQGTLSHLRIGEQVLQPREVARQPPPLGRRVKKPLPAIAHPGPLLHIILVEQLLQHAAEALLGDAQDIQQFGDGEAGLVCMHDNRRRDRVGGAERRKT